VAAHGAAIAATGTPVAFVHGTTAEEADPWFRRAGLTAVDRVSDPDLAHYAAFGLGTTGLGTLLTPKVWVRGAASAAYHGFGPQPAALIRQLPGAFVVHGRHLLAEFRHTTPADRPDYLALISRAGSVTIR
jgi:hypothetical protein